MYNRVSPDDGLWEIMTCQCRLTDGENTSVEQEVIVGSRACSGREEMESLYILLNFAVSLKLL